MDYRAKIAMPPSNYKRDIHDDDEDLETLRLAALRSLRTKVPTHKHQQKVLPKGQAGGHFQNKPHKSGNYVNNHRHNYKQSGNYYYHSANRNPNLIEIIPTDGNVKVKETQQMSRKGKGTEQKSRGVQETDQNLKTVQDTEQMSKKVQESEQTSKSVHTDEQKSRKVQDFKQKNKNDQEFKYEAKKIQETEMEPFKNEGSELQQNSLSDTKDIKETISQELSEQEKIKCESKSDKIIMDNSKVMDDPRSEIKDNENLREAEDRLYEDEMMDDQEIQCNEDDDDVLLMADLEEEDSLERLMDEMEKEMGSDYSPKREKTSPEVQLPAKQQESITSSVPKSVIGREIDDVKTLSSSVVTKDPMEDLTYRRSSLSPKHRSKKSPLRRSPIQSSKNSRHQIPRYKSSRASRSFSPGRNSPKPRSRTPEFSTRPINRKPSPTVQKLQRLRRSKSPHGACRSKIRRRVRSRSPRYSPTGGSRSPRPRSPRCSPTVGSRSPRPRSPWTTSPLEQRTSPHESSIKISPVSNSPWSLNSPQYASPLSPTYASPLSPTYAPHSPSYLRWSPSTTKTNWSPKFMSNESKQPQLQLTSENNPSPICSSDLSSSYATSPEQKRKESSHKKITAVCSSIETCPKDSSTDVKGDPILEARRRKFESITPIDPLTANKKIKLTRFKKDTLTEQPEKEKPKAQEITSQEEVLGEEVDECEYDDLVSLSDEPLAFDDFVQVTMETQPEPEKDRTSKKKKKKDKKLYKLSKAKKDLPLSDRVVKEKFKKRKEVETLFEDINDEETDLRTALSRRRAERLNRAIPFQTARILQSAFRGVVTEVAKNSMKPNQRLLLKDEEKGTKEVRRVTILQRTEGDLNNTESQHKHLKKRI